MKEIRSSTLRAHLARNQGADPRPNSPHPDADLLTAFAEDTLLDGERSEILTHLAVCPDCRAVVHTAAAAEAEQESEALLEPVAASPRLEPVPQPLVARAATAATPFESAPQRPPRRAWFPVLALAASLLVMAGSSVLFYRALHRPASTQTATTVQVPRLQTAPPAAPAAQISAATVTPMRAVPKHAHAQPRPRAAAPVLPTEEARIGAAPPPPAPAAAPSSSGSFGALSFQKAQNEPPAEQAQLHAQMEAEVRGNRATSDSAMAQAKAAPRAASPPVASSTQSVQVEASNALTRSLETTQPVAGFIAAPNATRPRFRISDEGRIERSVQASVWMPVAIASGIRFRVISVAGSDVWAGGDHLRLFHSADNGVTWDEVHLPATADRTHAIVHIRIDDAQHLTVEDDSGTSFSTTDAGVTWQ